MAKLKSLVTSALLHCILIVLGLVTALLVNVAFDSAELTMSHAKAGEEEFYKFLTQYAFFLNSSGVDIEFRAGMLESARAEYENFLHNIHYKRDCGEANATTAGGAAMCMVNGRLFDYFYLIQ